jgi:hypothetical protein
MVDISFITIVDLSLIIFGGVETEKKSFKILSVQFYTAMSPKHITTIPQASRRNLIRIIPSSFS